MRELLPLPPLKASKSEAASDRFKLVLDQLPVACLLIERRTGQIIFSNRVAKNMADLQSSTEDVSKEYFHPKLCTDTSGKLLQPDQMPLAKIIRGEMIEGFQINWCLPNGKKTLLFHSSILPLSCDFEGAEIVTLVWEDITQWRTTHLQLEEAVQLRDDFLSIASHELRTPLTGLKLNLVLASRMLEKHAATDSVTSRLLKKITLTSQLADRLTGLVDELLDVSRIAAGRLKLQTKLTNMSQLTKQIVASIGESLGSFENTFHEEIQENVVGYWDEVRLGQILTNLMTNASKYGAGKSIEIKVWKEQKTAYLSVRDHGIGIAPQDHERIFNRFERAIPSSYCGGLGVGLWIVRQVVEAHRGKIHIESQLGMGSTFTIEIPLRGRLEATRGKLLSELIPPNGMALSDFIPIAAKIAQRVDDIHHENIVLQTLRPESVVVDLETNEIWLAQEWEGFSVDRESLASKEQSITRLLQFISPEQTGRTNRSVDYRSDLYSMGLMFYTMLIGKPPFVTDDLVELMRWHVAKQPPRITNLRSDLPTILEDIVNLLLEKKPEDRYLSSAGVRADLEHCKQEYDAVRTMTPFKLREKDIPVTFYMSGRIYGREKEVATILRAFDLAAHGNPKLILVSGYSGIGKSSVVNEVYKPITDRRGYFVSGKFDQFKRDVPYDVLLQALRDLVRQILQESEAQIEFWKKEVLRAIDPNAQVIIDVIPQVEELIGPQSAAVELGTAESKNRFNRVMYKFISVFARKEHPLVIFLDDLQWSDRSTLNLIELILKTATDEALLLVGAYRDNEVGVHHPLHQMIDHLRNAGIAIDNIVLAPLNQYHVTQITADTCRTDISIAAELGALIYRKTAGNPFFVNQLLRNLYQQGLMKLDSQSQAWQWDMSEIEKLGITNDVVEMLNRRMRQFSLSAQHALRLAACIGNQFDLKTLAIISEIPIVNLFKDLKSAIEDGFILPLSKEYKTPEDMVELADKDISSNEQGDIELQFKFLHDRVQQAAYSLIDAQEKKTVHLKIGRLLLAHNFGGQLQESIFTIVTHLNHGLELIINPSEKMRVLELNLMAGRRARGSASFEAALRYLSVAVTCLPEQCWDDYYDLTFSCFLEKAEAEYLNANWDEANEIYAMCLKNVKNTLDKCRISIDKCISYRAKNDLKASLDAALGGLHELGYSLEAFPDWKLVIEEQEKTLLLLKTVGIEDLAKLPVNQDKTIIASSELFQELLSPTYLLGSNLLPIAAMKLIQLACRFGNTTGSVFGYLFYGFILASQFDEIDLGLKVGQIGLDLHYKLGTKKVESEIFDTWGGLTLHYKEPLQKCHPWLRKAFTSGIETGSYTWAGYSTINLLYQVFFGTETIPTVKKIVEDFIPALKNVDPNMRRFHLMAREAIQNLTETPSKKDTLMGQWINEEETLKFAKLTQDIFTQFTYYAIKMGLALWFGLYEKVVEYGDECKKYLTPGVFINPVFHFMHAVALTATYPDMSPEQQIIRRKQIDYYMDRINLWAKNCPTTYTHMQSIVQAGLAWIDGDDGKATLLIDKAIESALENNFIQNAAVAAEFGGRFTLRRGQPKAIGRAYIDEAIQYFNNWGATGRVALMKSDYKDILKRRILKTGS